MDVLSTPMTAAAALAAGLHNAQSNTLAEYTRPTRLEPRALVDRRLIDRLTPEQMVALEQTMLSVYAGLYMCAISLTCKVGNISPMQVLGQFGTNRSLVEAAGNSVYWAYESLSSDLMSLPTSAELTTHLYSSLPEPSIGMEGLGNIAEETLKVHERNGVNTATGGIKESFDSDKTIHNIVDESNLVVGKILNIPITSGNTTVTIQTTVTLRPMSVQGPDLVTIFKHNSRDVSFSARWHQARSGEIAWGKDWLCNMDLFEEYRKGLYADKTGILMNLKSTRSKNIWAAIISGKASPNAISAMTFMSKETAMNVQQETGYKFSHFSDREKLFEGTSMAWFIVVDTVRESFTIYSRGIEDEVDQTFHHIKGNAKNPKGVDINAVIDAYKAGNVSNMLN
jgi:hypothetical protein